MGLTSTFPQPQDLREKCTGKKRCIWLVFTTFALEIFRSHI